MKKVVRMLGLCALVALAFTSCKKNETNGNVTFKATINQPAGERTYMEATGLVKWSDNDKIYVFKGENEYISPTVNAGGSKDGYFSGDSDFLSNLGTPNAYSAFYPVDESSSIGNTVSMVIPNPQNYVIASFETNLYPMYAANGEGQNPSNVFGFHSDAGVITVAVAKAVDGDITSTFDQIEITAQTGADLIGTMTYAFDYPRTKEGTYALTSPSNQVILNCDPSNVELRYGDPTWFNIVVLPGTYNLTVRLLNNNQPITMLGEGVNSTNLISGESFTINSVEIGGQQRKVLPVILLN